MALRKEGDLSNLSKLIFPRSLSRSRGQKNKTEGRGERCVLAATAPLSLSLSRFGNDNDDHHDSSLLRRCTAHVPRSVGHNAPLIKHVTIYNYTSPLEVSEGREGDKQIRCCSCLLPHDQVC